MHGPLRSQPALKKSELPYRKRWQFLAAVLLEEGINSLGSAQFQSGQSYMGGEVARLVFVVNKGKNMGKAEEIGDQQYHKDENCGANDRPDPTIATGRQLLHGPGYFCQLRIGKTGHPLLCINLSYPVLCAVWPDRQDRIHKTP